MPETNDRRRASFLARLDERLGYHRDSLAEWKSGYLTPTEPDEEERIATMRGLEGAIGALEKARQDFLSIYGPVEPGFTLDWKHEEGQLAEALLGREYANTERSGYLDQVIDDMIQGGKTLRQIVDFMASEAQSLEELVVLVFGIGHYNGRTQRR